ncbi:unnamed protein product [Rhizoctonia solani]|uniref:Uncharacterized protein n=1 Tax=Rhizoctonia solani TaxID=456999 RepID=A0A8H3DWG4_9AGAM|nr:unnamed protein product [Rhizoctonia solani]
MNKSTSNEPTEGTTKRRSVGNPAAPYNAPIIENLPNELQLLAGNLKTLLDRLNEVPEFTDEAVNSPIKAFQDDLQYRFSCLREFEEQLKVLAVARYINDLTEDLGSHMDNMKNSLNIFIDVGVPTIRFYQTHAATGLQNLSTVATFLSGVTATTLQFRYIFDVLLCRTTIDDFKPAINPAVNYYQTRADANFVFEQSLVLSIASAINSQLAYHWRVAMYRSPNHYVPGWVSIWITHTPLFFLVISVIAFSVGLCAFTYSSDQSRAVSTLVTAFTAITSLALLKHLQFCPSGQYLATCSWDSTALIWGVRNQRFRIPGAEVVLEHTLHHQPQIGGFVNQVAWSPTGDQLLVRFVKSLQLCDPKFIVETGAYTKRFNRGRNVQATTWIPQSSSFLSVEWKIESNQAENRVYHVESIMGSDLVVLGTGEEEPRICHLPDLQVWDAAVMPDGYRVVVVATLLRSQSKCRPIKARHERRILIFNLETGSRERYAVGVCLGLHIKSLINMIVKYHCSKTSGILHLCTTKGDYALMSCESKASPQGWRIDKILEEGYHRIALAHTYFPKDKHQVYYAAPASFGGTDDQFVLAASKGNEIYIWERLSGILLHTIKTPDQELTNLAWNNTPPSGLIMLASAARDGTVRVWTAAASAGFSGADLPQPLSPETRTEPTSLATRQTNTRFQTKPNAR